MAHPRSGDILHPVNFTDALDALTAAKHQLARIELSLTGSPQPLIEIPTDLVQLKPTADRVWGGSLLRVKRVRGQTIEGYLLSPWRGGNREAWYKAKLCECSAVGLVPYPECSWHFANWYRDDVPVHDVPPPPNGFERARLGV